MKMMKLELLLISFPVEYLKEILIHKRDKPLKHPCMGFWFYMGCWVRILNRRNWWSTAEPKMFEGAPFILDKYMSSARFEGILSSL